MSNFHLCGFAGDFLRGIQLGLFGLPGYVGSAGSLYRNSLHQANRENRIVLQKTIATAAAFFPAMWFLTDDVWAAAGSRKRHFE
ncbi:MAG: hypothetical protein ACLUD2_17930 [Clostridium sp.]